MPKGGDRVGSGTKPSTERDFTPDESMVEPPEDLPADQVGFWRVNGPLAVAKGTLTAQTASAFRLLCEVDAEKRKTLEVIDRDGRTFVKVTVDGSGQEHQELKAHPLKADYAKLAKSVEVLMARFGLAPFGKPEAPLPKKKAVNQWAQIAQAS